MYPLKFSSKKHRGSLEKLKTLVVEFLRCLCLREIELNRVNINLNLEKHFAIVRIVWIREERMFIIVEVACGDLTVKRMDDGSFLLYLLFIIIATPLDDILILLCLTWLIRKI